MLHEYVWVHFVDKLSVVSKHCLNNSDGQNSASTEAAKAATYVLSNAKSLVGVDSSVGLSC